MRKTFLYPIINNFKKGNLSWLVEQSKKGLATKYLNKILPKKIVVGPTMAIFVLTYRCNSHCIMCDLPLRSHAIGGTKGGLPSKEFSTNEWKNVIDQLAEIKTAGIGFTGGEPLVRTDCIELMKYAKEKGMSVTLNTNAGLLTEEKINQILESGVDNINISLDGVGKTYDEIRGIPYKNVITNTKKLIAIRNKSKSNTKITMVMCVSHYNIKDMDKITSEAIKIGADKIGFIPLHHIPNTNEFTNESNLTNKTNRPLTCRDSNPNIGKIFLEKIDKIKKDGKIEVDNSKEYLNMFPLAFKGQEFPIPCLAGETSTTIDCYGNIWGCWPFLELKKKPDLKLSPKSPTTPKALTLKKLWFGKEYEEVRKKTSSCRTCFWNCQSELSIFYK